MKLFWILNLFLFYSHGHAWTPLVFPGECRTLQNQLAFASVGRQFLFFGGDGMENLDTLPDDLNLLSHITLLLTHGAGKPVITLVPVKSIQTNTDYEHASQTLHWIRSQSTGTIPLARPLSIPSRLSHHSSIVNDIEKSLCFLSSLKVQNIPRMPPFYIGHECLGSSWEERLRTQDLMTGKWYAGSGHFLWLNPHEDNQTQKMDFLQSVSNPIGVLVNDNTQEQELRTILRKLDPAKEPGRITLLVVVSRKNALWWETIEKDHPGIVWCWSWTHSSSLTPKKILSSWSSLPNHRRHGLNVRTTSRWEGRSRKSLSRFQSLEIAFLLHSFFRNDLNTMK